MSHNIAHYHNKPPCKPTSCSCKDYTDSSYGSSSTSSSYHKYNYVSDKTPDDSPPADPISVSLAVQAGQAINVPEAKLAYGFAQKPVDGQKKIHLSNVPEEDLFQLKSKVITLKKRTYAPKPDEEEYLEEEESESAGDDEELAPQLSYKQLGYVTEHYKNPKFRRINSRLRYGSKYDKYDDEGYGKVGGKVSVDCGFKPGRISSYRNSRREELNADTYY